MKKLLALSRLIDALNERVGRLTYWLVLVAVLVSAGNAIVRYTFNMSSNAWLEIQWYLFSAVFLFCAGYTVMSGLRNADLKPGERVAVLGLGGLGHLGLQMSKALGLETFAITGQADKKAELVGFGADEVLVAGAGADPGAVLRNAGGADVILSTTNSATQIAAVFGGLRTGGRLINLGVPDGPLEIDSRTLMWGQRQIRGSSQDERSDLREVLMLAAAGKVKAKIELYPLARVNEALARLQAGKMRYRAVLQHAV